MMGMGPHTYQVFSLAFLIPFFHRIWWYLSLFTQYQTFFFWLGSITWLFFSLNWNVRIKGNCFDGYGIGGPILIMLYSLNFHISAFRKEKNDYVTVRIQLFLSASHWYCLCHAMHTWHLFAIMAICIFNQFTVCHWLFILSLVVYVVLSLVGFVVC